LTIQKTARPKTGLLLGMAIALWSVMPSTVAFAQQAGVESEVISRFVRNNQEQRVWTSWEIGDDCKVVRGFNVKVSQLPQQGTVELRRTVRMITEDWLDNYRLDARYVALVRKCQGVELPVISVFFKAKPGYVGFDSMKVFITSTNGRQRDIDIRMSIR
jgi:hypothetical protein